MKKLTLLLSILFCAAINAQVGIGTISPDASSVLDIESSSQGILISRMTSSERDAIVSPSNGLMVFNTDTDELQFNSNSPGTPIWLAFVTTPTTTSAPGDSMKYSNTDITTNVNSDTAIQLPVFGTLEWNDNGSLFTVAGDEVTVADTGRYEIIVNVSLQDNVARGAPEMRLTVNGTEVGSYGSSGYIRNNNGHTESSLHIREVIELTAGDTIAVNVVRSANAGTVNMRSAGSSNFYIEN